MIVKAFIPGLGTKSFAIMNFLLKAHIPGAFNGDRSRESCDWWCEYSHGGVGAVRSG